MKESYQPIEIPIEKLNWESLISRIGMAQASVARFDGILQVMPNADLLLSPITTQEAVLSSRIEGTQASLEDVLRQDAAPSLKAENKDDIAEVQNYRNALREATSWMQKSGITSDVICHIHKLLMTGVRGKDKHPGNIRQVQNYIGYQGLPKEEAVFVPPNPPDLESAMPGLISFIQATHRDVIVQTALAHAQFELLHPFLDGNGRVGRMLIPLMLFEKGLIVNPAFYLSEYFEENRAEYYDRLSAISARGKWQQWVEFFLTATIEQASLNIQRATSILYLYNEMKSTINEVTNSQYALQTLDALFESPFISIPDFTQRSRIPRRTAERILESLNSSKIVSIYKKGAGRRPTLFAFDRLIAITQQKSF